MKKVILTFLFILLTVNIIYSQVIPIDSVRVLDGNGVPILNGQHVLVKGVVITQRELGPPLVYFQVPTAGLCAYDATFGAGVNRGDSIIVSGLVTNYNGLIELQPVDSFRVLATGITTPVPVSITPTQARSGELWESRLIKINGITDVKTTAGAHATTWSTASSGTNYWLFVGSDSCQVRIYTSTNIAGTMIPAFPFSMVAVMSQFTSNPPFNTGYQIIPRDLNDIVTSSGGPNIATTPMESNITQTSVTISFTTLSTGDTKVKYFVSDSIGKPIVYTDSVYNANQTTNHSIVINNLQPGKIYYATVSSTNTSGTSIFTPKYFSTQSHTGSTGKSEVYFNYPVDTTVALPNNKANGSVDYQTRLIQRIDSAQYSIDFAIYSFNDLTNIKQALINAMIRGVKIRIVYDSRTPQALMQDLINAGIRVQQRTTTSDLMHNKFFVFDGRNTNESSYSKKWLWTGSSNITYAQFYQDIENTIFLQDESLCNAYTREFEEMWGSHNDVNNPANAKFGGQKLDNTPHIFNINGKRIECYFSPSDNVMAKILTMLDGTDKSINFCIYDFTLLTLENKMKSKYNYPTRMVRGVFDRGQVGADSANGYLIYAEMKGISGNPTYNWNPPAKVFKDNYNSSYLFHDKYILVDADTLSGNPVIETGSFNFTNSAQSGNDENVLIIYDSLIANQYYQDFVKRLSDAGGTIDVKNISSEIPVKYVLNQNYPNPFNPVTSIRFQIPEKGIVKISVYDVLGRLVNTLVNKELTAGTYETNWNANSFASGVYFYTLEVNGRKIQTKSMVLIK